MRQRAAKGRPPSSAERPPAGVLSARAVVARVAVCLVFLLTGCASVPGRKTTLVDGRWVDVAIAGKGGPVVVFESGLGADLTAWDQVFPAVSQLTTSFVYSRPGYGASEPARTPRSARFVVEELRATLRKEGLAPPYVLVGHSLGGLYLQLFARRYPQEVAALLLLDSSHPSQMSGARGHPPITVWTTLLGLYMSGTRGQEFRALDASGRDVLSAPSLAGRPVIVINAGVDPTRSGRPLTEHERLRVDLFRLYPACRQRWVDSTHDLARRRPEVVIEAIGELVDGAR